MRSIISLITGAAFWLHVLLGCCAHHAHAADKIVCPNPASAESVGHGHLHVHDHSTPDSETPDHPGGSHDDCHESHCAFLVTGKTTIVLDTLVATLSAVPFDTVVAQTASPSVNWVCDTEDHLRLPVRLHLFNQVLLI